MAEMTLIEVRALLGLAEDAPDELLRSRLEAASEGLTLHTRLTADLHLNADASADQVVTGIQSARDQVVTHMRQEIATMAQEMKDLRQHTARKSAEVWLEGLSKERVVSAPLIDDLIEMHMQSPEKAERFAQGLMPVPDSSIVTGRAAKPSPENDSPVARKIRDNMA